MALQNFGQTNIAVVLAVSGTFTNQVANYAVSQPISTMQTSSFVGLQEQVVFDQANQGTIGSSYNSGSFVNLQSWNINKFFMFPSILIHLPVPPAVYNLEPTRFRKTYTYFRQRPKKG